MAVQITGRQIANSAVGVGKLDLSTGTFDFTSAVLQAATPTADSHAATKGYVDSVAQGLYWKDAAKCATTGNITLSGTQTIDGIAVVAGDRVLVRAQTSAPLNGLYIVDSGSWSRAADMNEASEFSGAAVFVQQGSTLGDIGFVCTSEVTTVGSDNVTFTQFTGAGQFTAGDGLDLTGSTFSVNVDGSSIEISGDALQVATGGITNDMLAGSIANAKLANSTISGVALGGTLGSLSASASGAISLTSYNGSAGVADLAVNVDGSSIEISSNALQVATAGITNDMLAGSIANAKLAGSITADKLNTGVGLTDSGGNLIIASGVAGDGLGYSSEVLSVNVDGSTIEINADSLRVVSGGIGNAQLATNAVTGAKIANNAITIAKLHMVGAFAAFDADGSTLAFEFDSALDLRFAQFAVVTVNGLVMEYKATPDAQDNYKIDNGGTNGVGRLVFGSNLANGDRVTVRVLLDNPE